MDKIRYLTMVVMYLVGCITAYGQSVFNPDSPQEPGEPRLKHTLTLKAAPEEGGYVSGGGLKYDGTTVTLSATAKTGYRFGEWLDEEGNVVSEVPSFSYTTKSKNETLYAYFVFDPSNPVDPSEPSLTLHYRLDLQPTQGCTVSGAGRYLAGTSVYITANVETGYEFKGWIDENGEVVSTATRFYYTKKAQNETLTASCQFNPSAPIEPVERMGHWVRVSCTDGGTVSGDVNRRILEGEGYSLYAYPNQGYEFLGWYNNGELYTTMRQFSAIMGKENMNFEARYRFNPTAPAEPPMAAVNLYTFYLMTVNGKPGETVEYPINLANQQIVRDINIRLMFPAGLEVEPTDYVLGENAVGYNVAIAETKDEYAITEEGAKVYDFSLIGGETSPATQSLITFKVKIPEEAPVGKYQVKVNQISMVMDDGTAVTARTRNGRIGVYKPGDVNGDNSISITDIAATISLLKGESNEELIEEAADTDEDGIISTDDMDITVDKVLKDAE